MTKKTDINPKPKLLSGSDLPFRERRRKKNLGQTPLMKWNLLIQISTILCSKSSTMMSFSLYPKIQQVFLSSHKKY